MPFLCFLLSHKRTLILKGDAEVITTSSHIFAQFYGKCPLMLSRSQIPHSKTIFVRWTRSVDSQVCESDIHAVDASAKNLGKLQSCWTWLQGQDWSRAGPIGGVQISGEDEVSWGSGGHTACSSNDCRQCSCLGTHSLGTGTPAWCHIRGTGTSAGTDWTWQAKVNKKTKHRRNTETPTWHWEHRRAGNT